MAGDGRFRIVERVSVFRLTISHRKLVGSEVVAYHGETSSFLVGKALPRVAPQDFVDPPFPIVTEEWAFENYRGLGAFQSMQH
jgi:hypothetical protein